MSRRPKAVQSVEVVLVDAFTSTPFTGNPAAVVPDATGLDEAIIVEVHGVPGRATRVRVGGQAGHRADGPALPAVRGAARTVAE